MNRETIRWNQRLLMLTVGSCIADDGKPVNINDRIQRVQSNLKELFGIDSEKISEMSECLKSVIQCWDYLKSGEISKSEFLLTYALFSYIPRENWHLSIKAVDAIARSGKPELTENLAQL
ncbi:MAG: hypothetical protein IH846_15155 [Acidobacteria bacterium]|nr:hypothetical protein [Acidobacteriota bacterium]